MENEEEEEPQENQFAANGNEPVGEEESEEPDIEARGAIHLALPNKDAKVFLDGQLVHGSGDKRLLLTPELEDKDKPHSFHLRTTWEENGRPAEREADLQVAAGNGIAINFTKPIDTGAGHAAFCRRRPAGANGKLRCLRSSRARREPGCLLWPARRGGIRATGRSLESKPPRTWYLT